MGRAQVLFPGGIADRTLSARSARPHLQPVPGTAVRQPASAAYSRGGGWCMRLRMGVWSGSIQRGGVNQARPPRMVTVQSARFRGDGTGNVGARHEGCEHGDHDRGCGGDDSGRPREAGDDRSARRASRANVGRSLWLNTSRSRQEVHGDPRSRRSSRSATGAVRLWVRSTPVPAAWPQPASPDRCASTATTSANGLGRLDQGRHRAGPVGRSVECLPLSGAPSNVAAPESQPRAAAAAQEMISVLAAPR